MIRKGALALISLAVLALGATPANAATTKATPSPVAVASVPTVMPAAAAVPVLDASVVPAPPSYLVVSGDTLGGIATRYCGSFGAYPGLALASGIVNADLIYPAQVIQLNGCTLRPSAPKPAARPAAQPSPVPVSSSAADRAVAFALSQQGKPYIWAAAGPNGYDCSGLVLAAYARVGVRLPHSSYEMINYGVSVSRSNLRAGDVIFPYSSLGHVVIYIGGGKIVEAPHRGAVVSVRALYSFYAARRYVS